MRAYMHTAVYEIHVMRARTHTDTDTDTHTAVDARQTTGHRRTSHSESPGAEGPGLPSTPAVGPL